MLASKKQFSDEQEVSAAMKSFYRKLLMADSYSPDVKLNTDVLLIKAQAGRQQGDSLGDDLGLGQVGSSFEFIFCFYQ